MNVYGKFLHWVVVCAILTLYSIAHAGIGLTYQGRILKPDGLPLDSSSVRFTIEIKSYNDCLLYAETQTVNLSSSSGVFSLNIGSAPAPQIYNYVGTSLSSVFTNRGSFTGLSGCTGGSYSPNADDDRRIVVSFEDLTLSNPTIETIPSQNISYVPFAIETYQISGYTSQNLLRVKDGAVAALTVANFNELMNLINGSSTQYVTAANNGVTSVAFAPGDFTGGTITSIGSVALKDITIGGTKGTATRVPQITFDNKGRVTGVTEVDISGIPASGAAGGDLSGIYPNPTIADNSITSAKIKDGEIVNADISPTAGIIDTKLATILTAGKVANSATTGTSINTPGTLVLRDFSGDFAAHNISTNQINTNETYTTDLYIRNASNKTVKFNIDPAAATNFTITWPTNTGSIGKVLSNDGNGNLSWVLASAGSVTSVTAGTGLNVGAGPGGSITSTGTLNVNVGTSANQIPQLDGIGKLNSSVLPTLPSGNMWVGNISNQATTVTMSGDATLSNTGALTLNTVPVTKGGTGLTTLGTSNQVLGVNNAGNATEYKTITAGSGVTINHAAGAVTINATGTGGTVTSITAGAGLTGGTITTIGTIGLDAELTGLNALTTTGFVKRTGAGTYTTSAAANLANDVTGILPIANGGTNSNTALNNNRLMASSGGAISELGALSDGQIVVGKNASAPQVVTLSGDATISNLGALTITNSAITNVKIANSAVDSSKIMDGSVGVVDLNFAGVMATNTGIIVRDGTQFFNKTCAGSETLIWNIANGWVCSSVVLTDKVGANTTNFLSKWNGTALVTSGVFENGGNVGIGTNNPTGKLDIVTAGSSATETGFILRNPSTLAYSLTNIDFYTANTWKTSMWTMRNNMGSGGIFGITLADSFGTPQERMRIMDSGNVGIGTIAPSEKLEVAGNVKATEFLYTSDARLKKDVTTLSNALEKVLQLRGVNFTWKANDQKTVGFIAQEVEKIYPELVRTDANSGYKAVQYGNIVAALVEALKQEHQERLETQNRCESQVKQASRHIASVQSETEIRVQKLEKENQELKARLERLEKVLLNK